MPLSLPLLEPEDVIRHLGKGKLHWKAGRSAHALATRWHAAKGVPDAVRRVLDTSSAFAGASLVDGFLERSVDLPGGGRPSRTDLMAVLRTKRGLAVAAVEGKVDEIFGPRIGQWLEENPGRTSRLAALTAMFGLERHDIALRYQLFHRSASALLEAQRYDASTALLLVHSFSSAKAGFADYAAFLRALGIAEEVVPNTIYGPLLFPVGKGAIAFFAGWAADDCADIAMKAEFWERLESHAVRARDYAQDLLNWIARRPDGE